MKSIEELNKLNELYEEECKIQDELERQQIEYLQKLRDQNKVAIDWFFEKGFRFKHPTIQKVTGLGPILHQYDNELYYWSKDRGIVRYDLRTEESKSSNLNRIIQTNGFMNAVQGIQYVNMILDEYLKEIKDRNASMKREIDALNFD